MHVYSVNDWNDDFKPKKPSVQLKKEENNERITDSAEIHAWEMRRNPSFLEKMMKEFLDNHGINYEFQKIFYIAGKNNYITQYFIVDFYIPNKKLILEVDGKFHKEQAKQDNKRTLLIKEHYRKTKVIRFTYKDMMNSKKLSELLKRLK